MRKYDVIVIGGGPAGICSALGSASCGAKTLIIERDYRLGGILNQCIHNGFGLHWFGEELTGTEYAYRLIEQIKNNKNIDILLNATCLSVGDDKVVTVVSPLGYEKISGKAIVTTTGCREKNAGSICLAGSRPAGVYTAGMAQKLCNIDGFLVGKNVVILGSGDIGLIMARRMTLEGANVKAVIELMPYSSGLKRNIAQCLNDYNIPLFLSHTITAVEGKGRVNAVRYAKVDENMKPILAAEERIECDTLLLSVGLTPENEIVDEAKVEMSQITGGAVVDENNMTSVSGIFSAGNCLHVNDLVDNVSKEARDAGINASNYANGIIKPTSEYYIAKPGIMVRYVLPNKISKLDMQNNASDKQINFYLRASSPVGKSKLIVMCGEIELLKKNLQAVTPGEMINFSLPHNKILGDIVVNIVKAVE